MMIGSVTVRKAISCFCSCLPESREKDQRERDEERRRREEQEKGKDEEEDRKETGSTNTVFGIVCHSVPV